MAARMGASTAMVTCVGQDSFGRDTVAHFADEGVDVDHVFTTAEAATGK